jgi:cysteine desulfurase/selenocysteine lyase
MERYKLPATARASFYVYTTSADVDALAEALERAKDVFAL